MSTSCSRSRRLFNIARRRIAAEFNGQEEAAKQQSVLYVRTGKQAFSLIRRDKREFFVDSACQPVTSYKVNSTHAFITVRTKLVGGNIER